MNKKFKKGLLSLLIVPAMLMTTACGKDDDKTKEFTESDKPVAYTTLRNNVKNLTIPTKDNKTAIETTAKIKMFLDVDMDNSGLTASEKEQFEEEMPSMDMSLNVRSSVGYIGDNTGYQLAERYNSESEQYELRQKMVTKKEDDKFYNYEYSALSSSQKVVYNVDANFAPNTYKMSDMETSEEGNLGPIFDYIQENETYDSFKRNVEEMFVETLPEQIPVTENTDYNASVDILFDENVYTIRLTLDINQLAYNQDGIDMKMDVDGMMELEFTEKNVLSAEMSVSALAKAEQKTNDLLETDTYEDTDVIKVSYEMGMASAIDFNAKFNDLAMDINTESYTGTGLNGAIENRPTIISFVFPELADENGCSEDGIFTFGDTVDLTLADRYLDSNLEVVGAYWDEACTDKVEATDKYPSYDTTVYVKVAPKTGYAIVSTTYTFDGQSEFDGYEVVAVADGYDFVNIPTSTGMEVEKIEVNGVEIAEEDIADGLTLESGKIYKVVYFVTEVVEEN